MEKTKSRDMCPSGETLCPLLKMLAWLVRCDYSILGTNGNCERACGLCQADPWAGSSYSSHRLKAKIMGAFFL